MHAFFSVQWGKQVYVPRMHTDLVAKLASVALTCQHVSAALRESHQTAMYIQMQTSASETLTMVDLAHCCTGWTVMLQHLKAVILLPDPW